MNRVRYILTEDEYSLAGTLSTVRMQKKKKKKKIPNVEGSVAYGTEGNSSQCGIRCFFKLL